ncbi:MAG: hypothetical protein LC620_05735, partial [Halobacteriales archaeon]|nr:hypothetical protein [Halobacteriales archaeon]
MNRNRTTALTLAAIAALVPAAQADDVTVNLLWAEDHGCTPDTYTAADMRVTVKLDGDVVLQAYAPQQNRPDYAAAAK